MFGGLKKSASRLALVAAAGALATTANAADLGGDCCADLEERVAELEATTARKGNRRVSLTVSGQVNRAIMYYNDGSKSNAFYGLDNTNSSTRFGFSGSAKITPSVTAGFTIVLDVADTGRTVAANQVNEDGGSLRGGNVTSTPFRNNTNGDHLIRMRNAFWYLESASLGRINVGRMATSGSAGVLDLGGVSVIAATGEGCIGTGLIFRDSASGRLASGSAANGVTVPTATATISAAGVVTPGPAGTANPGRSIGSNSMSCAHPTYRAEAIQYVSPTFAGFSFSASAGESMKSEVSVDQVTLGRQEALGTNYGADLKYAGEFSGVRIAAALGWESSRRNDDDGVSYNSRYTQWGGSLSLLHVPTGLFAQGYYSEAKSAPFDSSLGLTSGGVGGDTTAKTLQLQAGIRQNFFGIGATVLYGEYVQMKNWGQANSTSVSSTGVPGSGTGSVTASVGTTNDKMTVWGVGLVQNIDAAAMELYLGYRNYKATDGGGGSATANFTGGALTSTSVSAYSGLSLKSIDVVAAGARIRF